MMIQKLICIIYFYNSKTLNKYLIKFYDLLDKNKNEMLINIISKLLQKIYQIKHDYYVCNDIITIISNTLYHIVNNKYVYLLYFSFLLELIL